MVQESPFLTAADGDESSDSIELFAETLDDDVMFTPDLFENNTDNFGTSFTAGTWPAGILASTHAVDAHTINAWTDGGVGWIQLNFTEPCGHIIEGWNWNVYAKGHTDDDWSNFSIYNWDTHSWDYQSDVTKGSYTWLNGTTYDPDYWSGSECAIRVQSEDSAPDVGWAYINCTVSRFYIMTLADSDHYAESFAGVDDWTTSDCSISSDGDLATITENGAGSTGRAYDPFSSTDHFEHYYEFRIESMTATTANLEFWDGVAYNTLKTFTAAGTYKGIISDTDAATMQRIGFLVGSEGGNLKPDYLRLFPANESGWSFDGSTTAAVEEYANSEYDYYISTDGDILNMTSKRGTGSDTDYNAYYKMYYDTTATKLDLENTYYQFLEFRYRVADPSTAVWIYAYMDGKLQVHHLNEDGAWHTERWNIAAAGAGSSLKYIRWNLDYTFADDSVATLLLDYAKYYSIANFTVTQSGVTTDDYLYVDSGVLYSSIDDGYIELNHDPTLTVNTATYNVWNLTTGGTSPEFDNYVGSWAGYSSETRGSLSSGTLTDFRLKFDSTESISAIKFIEDGTAPVVVRSSSTPNDPEDDESTTLSAVITDTVEVYSVAFNAIVYPTGFSDVDYDATEQADNLWNYTFSSLDAGYYCFKIIASDGANTNALTEYAYIELTVREAAIMVEEITLIGAGEDFTMMTFSARINRDCSYTIYEESASSAESDTHTGSVSSPSFNLAWTKLDVDDNNVNFTIKFTSGSLTYNYTSQYQVAQNTFYISTVMQVDGLDTVTVLGRISKLGNYLLYDENNELKDSGSITDLDFTIRFTKWSGYDEQDHDFAIKFTNGTQTCWYNSSYYAFKKPVAAAVVTTDKNALYAFQASFWTAIMILFVLGMVGVDFYRRYWKN